MMFMLLGTCSVYAQEESQEGIQERQEQRLKKGLERRERMKSLKIAYMTEQLALTPEESEKFWPVYNQYQDQLNDLRKKNQTSKKPEEMTEAEAETFLAKRLQMEDEKLAIKRGMARDIQPIIGPKRVLVMAQSEDRFRKKVLSKAGKKRGKEQGKRKRKQNKQKR